MPKVVRVKYLKVPIPLHLQDKKPGLFLPEVNLSHHLYCRYEIPMFSQRSSRLTIVLAIAIPAALLLGGAIGFALAVLIN